MRILDRAALLAAPLAWFIGWSIMRAHGEPSPGPAWTAAHMIWIGALIAFIVAGLAIYRVGTVDTRGTRPVGPVSKNAARIGLGLTITGAAGLIVQMVIDLAVGFTSTSHTAMDAAYHGVFATPGVELIIYQIAPAALFVGLAALVVSAATQGRVQTSAAVLAVAGVLTSALGHGAPGALRVIEGLGDLVVLAAMTRVMRPVPHRGLHRTPQRRPAASITGAR